MNRHLTLLCIGACLGLTIDLAGQDEIPSPAYVEFDLLVVQIPEKAAIPLIAQLRDKKRSEKAVTRILDLIASDKARLVAWPTLTTTSGQRAVVEQVDEFRYATEYEQAVSTKRIENVSSNSGTPGAPIVPVDPASAPPVEPKPARVRTIHLESEGVPKSFETRNVGVTLEIEPVIGSDGQTINLSLVPQHVSLLEMRRVEMEEVSTGKKSVVYQPVFVTNKVTTSFAVPNGDYSLLGTFKVSKPEGYIELFILHTQIKRLR